MADFNKLILVAKNDEFQTWKDFYQEKEIDKEPFFKYKGLNIFLFNGGTFDVDYDDDLCNILTESTADENTILAVHFGYASDNSDQLYDILNGINKNKTEVKKFKVGVIMKYSLGIVGGYPNGLAKEYKEIQTNSVQDPQNILKVLNNVFDLFKNEATKKKYDEIKNKIVYIQQPISSILGLVKENAVNDKILKDIFNEFNNALNTLFNDIKNDNLHLLNKSTEEELSSIVEKIQKNNQIIFSDTNTIKKWLEELNDIKNKLDREKPD